MRLVTARKEDRIWPGAIKGDQVIDLSEIAPTLQSLLAEGEEAMDEARAALEAGAGAVPLADIELLSPIPSPRVILAIGLNYQDHIDEFGSAERKRPDHPVVFNKQVGAINGPSQPFHLPSVSEALDYEGELAVIIGRRCRHVPKEKAFDVIAGYAVANDVSVRDFQRHSPTMTMGKSFDTHCPLGPALVTADEIADPQNLDIKTWVNGEIRQDSNTRHLIFKIDELIAYLTSVMTFEPGDILLTGTPAGVAAAMDPPKWLKAGDTVRIEIEGVGLIENSVIAEPV